MMANRPNPILEDLARLRRELAALSKMTIHVGIQGDEDGDLLKIAAVHEYGMTIKMTDKMRRYLGAIGMYNDTGDYTPPAGHQEGYINIPERSYIRASYDTGKQGIDGVVRMAVNRIFKGEWTAQQAADNIGLFCVQMTRDFIDTGQVQPPVSEFTQDGAKPRKPRKDGKPRKVQNLYQGKSVKTTLVDSGRLSLSITHRVEGGG